MDDSLVGVSTGDLEKVFINRGPAIMKDGQLVAHGNALKKETGSSGLGLVKFIWKHGENSADAVKVTKDDIVNFPAIAKNYEPIEDRSGYKRWSILREDGEQLNYILKKTVEGRDITVSIYGSDGNHWKSLSRKR